MSPKALLSVTLLAVTLCTDFSSAQRSRNRFGVTSVRGTPGCKRRIGIEWLRCFSARLQCRGKLCRRFRNTEYMKNIECRDLTEPCGPCKVQFYLNNKPVSCNPVELKGNECPSGRVAICSKKNPCESAVCNYTGFLTAECAVDHCGGCNAKFFVDNKWQRCPNRNFTTPSDALVVTSAAFASLSRQATRGQGRLGRIIHRRPGVEAHECPNEERAYECPPHICTNATCPSNSKAKCRINNCGGCRAEFYINKNIVIGDCGTNQCPRGVKKFNCKLNPCSATICPDPKFRNAECTAEYCGGCFGKYFVDGRWQRCPESVDGIKPGAVIIESAAMSLSPWRRSPEFRRNERMGRLPMVPNRCPRGQTRRDCPRNLCQQSVCPSNPDAICRVNNCGRCEAEFFVDGIDITKECKAVECPVACLDQPCKYATCKEHQDQNPVCINSMCHECRARWFLDGRQITCSKDKEKEPCPNGEERRNCTITVCRFTQCPTAKGVTCSIDSCGGCYPDYRDAKDRPAECIGWWTKYEMTRKDKKKIKSKKRKHALRSPTPVIPLRGPPNKIAPISARERAGLVPFEFNKPAAVQPVHLRNSQDTQVRRQETGAKQRTNSVKRESDLLSLEPVLIKAKNDLSRGQVPPISARERAGLDPFVLNEPGTVLPVNFRKLEDAQMRRQKSRTKTRTNSLQPKSVERLSLDPVLINGKDNLPPSIADSASQSGPESGVINQKDNTNGVGIIVTDPELSDQGADSLPMQIGPSSVIQPSNEQEERVSPLRIRQPVAKFQENTNAVNTFSSQDSVVVDIPPPPASQDSVVADIPPPPSNQNSVVANKRPPPQITSAMKPRPVSNDQVRQNQEARSPSKSASGQSKDQTPGKSDSSDFVVRNTKTGQVFSLSDVLAKFFKVFANSPGVPIQAHTGQTQK